MGLINFAVVASGWRRYCMLPLGTEGSSRWRQSRRRATSRCRLSASRRRQCRSGDRPLCCQSRSACHVLSNRRLRRLQPAQILTSGQRLSRAQQPEKLPVACIVTTLTFRPARKTETEAHSSVRQSVLISSPDDCTLCVCMCVCVRICMFIVT